MLNLGSLFELGSGVRSLNKAVMPNIAITGSKDSANIITSSPSVDLQIIGIKEEKALHAALGFSIDDLGTSATGYSNGDIDLGLAAKVELANKVTMDSQYVYFMIKKSVTTKKSLTNNITLSDAAAQLVGAQEDVTGFYTLYGDKFVNQITTGSEMIAIIKIVSNVKSQSSSQVATTQLNVDSIIAQAKSVMSGNRSNDSFEGVSHSGCWLYLTGVDGARNYTLDMKDLGAILTSLSGLLNKSDANAEVLLSCKIAPYSIAQLPQITVSLNQTQAQKMVSQQILTERLQNLDSYIRNVRELWEDVSETFRFVNAYLKKYNVLWEAMHKEREKYKDDIEVCELNRDILRAIYQKLMRMTDEIVSTAHFDGGKIQQYKKSLNGAEYTFNFVDDKSTIGKEIGENTLYLYIKLFPKRTQYSMKYFDGDIMEDIDFCNLKTKIEQKKYIEKILNENPPIKEKFPSTIWINGYKDDAKATAVQYAELREKTYKFLKKLKYKEGHRGYFSTEFARNSKQLFWKSNRLQDLYVKLERDNIKNLPADATSGFILQVRDQYIVDMLPIKLYKTNLSYLNSIYQDRSYTRCIGNWHNNRVETGIVLKEETGMFFSGEGVKLGRERKLLAGDSNTQNQEKLRKVIRKKLDKQNHFTSGYVLTEDFGDNDPNYTLYLYDKNAPKNKRLELIKEMDNDLNNDENNYKILDHDFIEEAPAAPPYFRKYRDDCARWMEFTGKIHLSSQEIKNIQSITKEKTFEKYKLFSFERDKTNGKLSIQPFEILDSDKIEFEAKCASWSARADGDSIPLSSADCANIARWTRDTQRTYDSTSFIVQKVNYAPSDPLRCLPTGHTYSDASRVIKTSGSYTINFFRSGDQYRFKPVSHVHESFEVEVYEVDETPLQFVTEKDTTTATIK